MNKKILSVVLLSNLVYILSNYVVCEMFIGNMRDEHNCIGSAGYVWCQSLGICVKPWEVGCPML